MPEPESATLPDGADPLEARFLAHLGALRNASDYTVRNYAQALREFRTARAGAAGFSWTAVRAEACRAWLYRLAREGKHKPASIRLRFAALRSFFAWALREGLVAANPAKGIPLPKLPRRLPLFLTTEQIALLLDAPRRKRAMLEKAGKRRAGPGWEEWQEARDTAWLELFYGAGLRIGELTGLDASRYDRARGLVR
ncbi:MAG TPA: site-specific integrase, partial [Candidatus Methylacidiphilales bacterium]